MKKNNENRFKTPEGYFDSFNERLMDKIAQEESIIPKNDGFGVPDGYFASIDNQISEKLKAKESKVVQLKPFKKQYYAAAAVAAIIVLGLWFTQNEEPEFGFDDLASTELDAYFLNADIDLTAYDLAEAVAIEELTIMDFTEANDTLENEMIIDYLDDTIDEIEDLNLDYEEFN